MSYEDARLARIEMIKRHNAEWKALGRGPDVLNTDKRALRARQETERREVARVVFLAIANR